jgi:hypothetical protein
MLNINKTCLLFKTLAEKTGAQLLFVLIITKGEDDVPARAMARDFLTQNGIPYLDLRDSFSQHAWSEVTWPNDGHWNIAGNQLAADIVGKYIAEHYTFK